MDLGCGRAGPGLWLARQSVVSLVEVDFSPVGIDQAAHRRLCSGWPAGHGSLLAISPILGFRRPAPTPPCLSTHSISRPIRPQPPPRRAGFCGPAGGWFASRPGPATKSARAEGQHYPPDLLRLMPPAACWKASEAAVSAWDHGGGADRHKDSDPHAAATRAGLGLNAGDDLWVSGGQDGSYSEWWRKRITLRGFVAAWSARPASLRQSARLRWVG